MNTKTLLENEIRSLITETLKAIDTVQNELQETEDTKEFINLAKEYQYELEFLLNAVRMT